MKSLGTLKSSIPTSDSINSASNRENKHKRLNNTPRSDRSSRFFTQKAKDSNFNGNEKHEESYLSILYRNGKSKYSGYENQGQFGRHVSVSL